MTRAALLVEDDPGQQVRLASILMRSGFDAEKLHRADSIAAGKRAAAALDLEIALVDLGLPDGNGIELIGWLRMRDANLPILVVSSWNTEEMILDALRSGATGYLLKEREDLEIELSVRSAQRGGAPIDPFVARRILALSGVPQSSPPLPAAQVDTSLREALTRREFSILELVAKGMSNREIAENLGLSRLTVETHVKHIYGKLAVGSRTEAVYEARMLGLLR